MKSNRTATAAALALLLVILAVSIFPAAAAPQPAPLMSNPGATGLVSCWSLNETSGNRADLYGGNTLTDNNTVGYATGKVGNAADFELDTSEYFTGNGYSLASKSFTIAGWVNLESKTANRIIASQWDFANNRRQWQLIYQQSTDRFVFQMTTDGTFTTAFSASADSFGSPSTGTWYYIVGTYNRGTSISISINGTTDTTNTANLMYTTQTAGYGMGMYNPVGGTNYYDGLMDEFIFYERALTSDEISWLYNSGNGRACSVVNPTPTPTATATVTATVTPTPTPTVTSTATETATPTVTLTGVPSTATPTVTATVTATITSTVTETITPTATATGPTPTPSNTPEPGATPTYPNTVTYGDLIQITLLTGLCIAAAVFLIFYILFHTLLRRK
jgi:hypothetical protein